MSHDIGHFPTIAELYIFKQQVNKTTQCYQSKHGKTMPIRPGVVLGESMFMWGWGRVVEPCDPPGALVHHVALPSHPHAMTHSALPWSV